MAQVNVEINNKKYAIACDDGQEAHLHRLGQYIDKRIKELVAAVGQVGDTRLLVMVSLLIADELSDAYSDLDVAKTADDGVAAQMIAEEKLSAVIDDLAARLENMAEKIKPESLELSSTEV